MKVVKVALVACAVLSTVAPALAQSGPGWSCTPYGCRKTSVLWSYGVPGATVGFYQSRCAQDGARYAGSGSTYAAVRPGQIWGSNVVPCYVEQQTRRGG